MKYKEIKIFGFVLFLMLLIIIIVFFGYFKLSLELNLNGSSVILNVGDSYQEPGYTANFLWLDLKDKVEINNNVNVANVGTHYVYYHINYLWFDEVAKRRVIIEDNISPSIELLGSKTLTYYVGDQYQEPGYKATDNYDGDLTGTVEIDNNIDLNNPGTYYVKYKVKDSSSNETTLEREIIVKKKIETIQKVETIPVNRPTPKNEKGVIYLTFDDGPSASITSKILDILKAKNVKATFFVVNRDKSLDYLIKRQYNEGHTVGLHSYTHDYKLIYQSTDNYFSDLEKMSNRVEKIIGIKSNIIRFPGGSSNTVSKKYKVGIMSELTKEVINKGYRYYDWNVDSKDAGGAKSKEEIYHNVTSNLSINNENIVLMHDFDNNYITLNALSDIIDYGKNNGYTFKAIKNDTNMITHRVVN